MAMAINNVNQSIAANSGPSLNKAPNAMGLANEEVASATVKGQDTAAAIAKSDSVVITDKAKSLSDLQKSAKNSSGIDEKKVASIKKAVADGSYKVDGFKVASRMMAFESELSALYN